MNYSKIIFRTIAVFIVSFPILGAIQLFSGSEITPYDDFIGILKPGYEFVQGKFSWLVVAFLSYLVLARKTDILYIYQEKIRKRQYFYEYERWRNTPFIPPVLYYYMMAPPVSFSPLKTERANNDFYPLIVRDFQDRVSMHANFNESDPLKRVSMLRVVGVKIFGVIVAHYVLLAIIMIYALSLGDLYFVFTNTYGKFLIPLILHLLGYVTMVMLAIAKTAPWDLLDNKLHLYFKEDYLHHEPRIPWVEVLPDTEAGYGIEKMWERDCYRRIQLTYDIEGRVYPHDKTQIVWDNPSIPSNPFPDNLDMTWAPKAREHVAAIENKWQYETNQEAMEAIEETKDLDDGQVVAFQKRKRG